MRTALFVALLLCLAWCGRDGIRAAEKHCPATQPGLVLRDFDHPWSSRAVDREFVVTVTENGDYLGILQPGLNQSQAEALAVQLGRVFPGRKFEAHPQIALEPRP